MSLFAFFEVKNVIFSVFWGVFFAPFKQKALVKGCYDTYSLLFWPLSPQAEPGSEPGDFCNFHEKWRPFVKDAQRAATSEKCGFCEFCQLHFCPLHHPPENTNPRGNLHSLFDFDYPPLQCLSRVLSSRLKTVKIVRKTFFIFFQITYWQKHYFVV